MLAMACWRTASWESIPLACIPWSGWARRFPPASDCPRRPRAAFLFGAVLAPLIVGGSGGPGVVGPPPRLRESRAAYPRGGLPPQVLLRPARTGRRRLRVVRPLEHGNLEDARAALRSLCSRDPSELTSEGLLAATIESLAENASDSFVAPLFFYALFGVPGAVGYRAVNTLDAMIGYRGEYEWLGKCAARLDDLANLIPAR